VRKVRRGGARWGAIAGEGKTLEGMKAQESSGSRRYLKMGAATTDPRLARGLGVELHRGGQRQEGIGPREGVQARRGGNTLEGMNPMGVTGMK